MHVMVTNLDAWWAHIASLDLPSRYGVQSPRAPKLEPWGLNTAYVFRSLRRAVALRENLRLDQ